MADLGATAVPPRPSTARAARPPLRTRCPRPGRASVPGRRPGSSPGFGREDTSASEARPDRTAVTRTMAGTALKRLMAEYKREFRAGAEPWALPRPRPPASSGPSSRPGSASLSPSPALGPGPRPLLREALGARAGGAAGRLWAVCGPGRSDPSAHGAGPCVHAQERARCAAVTVSRRVSSRSPSPRRPYLVQRTLGAGEAAAAEKRVRSDVQPPLALCVCLWPF